MKEGWTMKASSLISGIFLGTVLMGLVSSASAADPNLIAVYVFFDMPQCGGRDPKTAISITIDNNGAVYAQNTDIDPGRKYKDPGWYGPKMLPILQAVSKSSYIGSTTHIHIDPSKPNTWCTKIDVQAIFSDHSQVWSTSGNVITISQTTEDAEFVNNQLPNIQHSKY